MQSPRSCNRPKDSDCLRHSEVAGRIPLSSAASAVEPCLRRIRGATRDAPYPALRNTQALADARRVILARWSDLNLRISGPESPTVRVGHDGSWAPTSRSWVLRGGRHPVRGIRVRGRVRRRQGSVQTIGRERFQPRGAAPTSAGNFRASAVSRLGQTLRRGPNLQPSYTDANIHGARLRLPLTRGLLLHEPPRRD